MFALLIGTCLGGEYHAHRRLGQRGGGWHPQAAWAYGEVRGVYGGGCSVHDRGTACVVHVAMAGLGLGAEVAWVQERFRVFLAQGWWARESGLRFG